LSYFSNHQGNGSGVSFILSVASDRTK